MQVHMRLIIKYVAIIGSAMVFSSAIFMGTRVHNYFNSPHSIEFQKGVIVASEKGGEGGIPREGNIVASKAGKRYYFKHCSGVKRIKEANKVYFSSESEAQARGLTLASGCS